jgi:hypothetical protein
MGLAAHVSTGAPPQNGSRYAVSDHLPTLELEIKSIIEHPHRAQPRETVELTLTNGYAHALELEGERLRAESRLRTLIRSGGARRQELETAEVELHRVASDLGRLRALLANLRAHAL